MTTELTTHAEKASGSGLADCLPPPFYHDDRVTIYHADCRDLLHLIHEVNLLLVDPPYGIQHCVRYGPKLRSKNQTKLTASWHGTQIANDHSTELSEWLIDWALERKIKAAIFAHPSRPLTRSSQRLVWSKPSMSLPRFGRAFRQSFEDVYLFGDWTCQRVPMHGVLEGKPVENNESRGRKHPHQKPMWLLKTIIDRSERTAVLDPCAGSGTTLAAAKVMGCTAIGIEIEEKYCEIAADRVRQDVLF